MSEDAQESLKATTWDVAVFYLTLREFAGGSSLTIFRARVTWLLILLCPSLEEPHYIRVWSKTVLVVHG